jgi:DNA polymerase-1
MAEVKKPKKFAIIDGKSVFYRGYYALPNLTTRDGKPTGGVFGFTTMALEVIKRLKPDYVAVAWDKPKTNIRKRLAMYPAYKAGRKPAPPDFYEQIPILHELLKAFGWPLYELDDYEADDIMGALAAQAQKRGIETLLVTSDLDALQLVGPLTKVYVLKKGLSNIQLYSPASFEAKYGIEVKQFLDLKSLQGDSSDNIPGVPGIGPKTALELLKTYHTLDGVYQNLGIIKASIAKKLEAGKDLAYLSKRIAAIWTDAPVKLNLKEVDGSRINPEALRKLLENLEFKSLLRRLPANMQAPMSASLSQSTQGILPPGNNTYIKDFKELQKISSLPTGHLTIHSRCAAAHGREPQLIIISPNQHDTYTLDVKAIGAANVKQFFVHCLNDKSKLIGYDLKATLQLFIELGIALPKVGHDVFVAAFVLNPLRREQTLTELATTDLDYHGSDLDNLNEEELIQRAPEIISIINGLQSYQQKELAKVPKFPELLADIEWPVIPVLAKMEYEGIKLDTKYLKHFSVEINDVISDLKQHIYGYADQEFNIASPQQLAEVLFTKLNLPTAGIKKGKTGYSTAAVELDKLRGTHPIINLISQYREVTKLKNTYVDTLPLLVDKDSRLHTTFNLTIAQTGRLSSTDPNLQNIPVRTDLGKHIRTAFVADEGNDLISADYSQIELRLAAVMSQDKDMIDVFNRGVDIHTQTAAQVYKRQPEDVTKQMRRAAKVINFGILYGMSPHGLSVAAEMTRAQAEHFISQYFEIRKPLLSYMNSLKDKARNDGYVETIFGRRRPMPDINSSNFAIRSAAERAAMNMPIQGTEADLMKMAMVAIDKALAANFPKARMLLQIHDSILVETPTDESKAVGELLKSTMENIYKLPVNLDVDVSIGKNWGDL